MAVVCDVKPGTKCRVLRVRETSWAYRTRDQYEGTVVELIESNASCGSHMLLMPNGRRTGWCDWDLEPLEPPAPVIPPIDDAWQSFVDQLDETHEGILPSELSFKSGWEAAIAWTKQNKDQR